MGKQHNRYLNLPRKRPRSATAKRKVPLEAYPDILEAYLDDVAVADIAAVHDVTAGRIYQIIREQQAKK